MAQAFTPGLKISAATPIERHRELPVSGEILVNVGQNVQAADVIGRAYLPGDLHIVRVAERMGIEPFEVMKGLRVQEGDELQAGALICEHAGLFGLLKSRFLAPLSGQVEFITQQTGHLGLRMPRQPIELSAYIGGSVVAVDAGKSATIQTYGALVQGIFGVGGERRGRLRLLPVSPESQVEERDIPSDCRGEILVGGARPALQALSRASTLGAVGFITGSIDDTTLAAYLGFDLGVAITGDEAISMSLMFTEGFGLIPVAARVLEVLGRFEGQQASLNGATQVRAGAVRPEVIVSHGMVPEESKESFKEPVGLALGRRIRLIRVPYFGMSAVVVELPHEVQKLENGASARVLRARLEDGRVVVVPRANVEIA